MPPHLPPEILTLILTHATRLTIHDHIARIKAHFFHCYINYTDPSRDYATVVRDTPGTRAKKALQLVSKGFDREVKRAWGLLLQKTEEGAQLKELVRAMEEGRLEAVLGKRMKGAEGGQRVGMGVGDDMARRNRVALFHAKGKI